MAIAELTSVENTMRASAPSSGAVLRGQLRQLRSDAGVMVSLVDASAAFCRGMSLRIGADIAIAEEFAPLSSSRSQYEA